jgi:hypothetical protein
MRVRYVQRVPGETISQLEGEMRIAALTIALVAAVACSRTVKVNTNPKDVKVDVDIQKPGVPEDWKGTLSAAGGSSVSGTAMGTTAHDSSHVTVSIVGGTPGTTLPWHVHEGKCSDASAPVVGPPTAYPPLVVGSDGKATATAHLAVQLNEAKNYIINVHASPTNMGTIVACGDYND